MFHPLITAWSSSKTIVVPWPSFARDGSFRFFTAHHAGEDRASRLPASALSDSHDPPGGVRRGQELKADVLLIDDMKARRLAREKGLAVLGCVGVLHDAFCLKLVADLTAAYRQLLASGAYVDRLTLEKILKILNLPPL